MTIVLTLTPAETSVTLSDETNYSPKSKTDYASILYVNNKKTTGDVPLTIATYNPINTIQWILANLGDGYYKAELLAVPTFQIASSAYKNTNTTMPIGVVTYYNNKLYRNFNAIPGDSSFPTPDEDYNNWEEISTTPIESVYNEALQATFLVSAQIGYGFIEFVFYNNLVYAFLNKSAEITKSCNICANPEIEELRCLRDKYESVELAVAAHNYSGAQMIIESSENLVNSCSC